MSRAMKSRSKRDLSNTLCLVSETIFAAFYFWRLRDAHDREKERKGKGKGKGKRLVVLIVKKRIPLPYIIFFLSFSLAFFRAFVSIA